MKTMEYFITLFADKLKQNGISKVVYTKDAENSIFIDKLRQNGCSLYDFTDARSVGYAGTGMAAEALEAVVICADGEGDYHNFMPALTEAHYRNLPVIAVSFSKEAVPNCYLEPKDTVIKNVFISCRDTESDALKKFDAILKSAMPVHLNFDMSADCEYTASTAEPTAFEKHRETNSELFAELKNALSGEYSLYIDCDIAFPVKDFPQAKIIGGGVDDNKGRLATVLGASLAGKKDKYIGIVTEKNAMVDINSLGNREVNSRLVFIVLCDRENKILSDYAEDLSFTIKTKADINEITAEGNKPTIYFIGK